MKQAQIGLRVFAVLTVITSLLSIWLRTQGNPNELISGLSTLFALLTVLTFVAVGVLRSKQQPKT